MNFGLKNHNLKAKIKDELKLFGDVIGDEDAGKLSQRDHYLVFFGGMLGIIATALGNCILYSLGPLLGLPQEFFILPTFVSLLLMFAGAFCFMYLAAQEAHLEKIKEGQHDNRI